MQIRLICAVMGSTIMPSCLDLLCSVFYAKMAPLYHTLRQLMTEPLIVWQSRSVLLVTCLPLPWWMPCLSVFGGALWHTSPRAKGGGLRGKHDHICYSYPILRISDVRHFFPKHPQDSATWIGGHGEFSSIYSFPPRVWSSDSDKVYFHTSCPIPAPQPPTWKEPSESLRHDFPEVGVLLCQYFCFRKILLLLQLLLGGTLIVIEARFSSNRTRGPSTHYEGKFEQSVETETCKFSSKNRNINGVKIIDE